MAPEPETNDDVDWLTEAERSAWLAVAALSMRLPAALDVQLQRDSELNFFEYLVMAMLSEQPDRTLQMSELARVTASSLSRLSHTARRLEQAGYLTRRRIPGGGRRTAATLTEAGWAKVVEAAPAHVREVRRLVFDAAEPEEIAALAGIGRKVVRAIDPEEPCM